MNSTVGGNGSDTRANQEQNVMGESVGLGKAGGREKGVRRGMVQQERDQDGAEPQTGLNT